MEEHTVEVRFRKDLRDYEDSEEFVEACLTGNRSNSFARVLSVRELEDGNEE